MMNKRMIFKIGVLVATLAATVACSPQVQTQFVMHRGFSVAADSQFTILVLGSSVAAGWVTSYQARHDLQNGYAGRLGRLLESRGDTLINHSIPGNSSADILERMDDHLLVAGPEFVLIGLSLGNERLDEDRDAAVTVYRENLPKIIERCREEGRTPVVGLCYPYNRYDETDYEYLKRMNIEIDSWGVPAVNLLGAVDNGNGHFVEGCTFDEGHPDNHGHEEMFLAVVPSLFDALASGRPAPARPAKPGHTSIKSAKHGSAPLSYVPDEPVHSFAVGFSFRTGDTGTLAAVDAGGHFAVVELVEDGKPVYTSGHGIIKGAGVLADNAWHDVVLSHRYLQGKTLLFVDGRLVGEAQERIEPRRFILGGSGGDAGDAPKHTDYRDWLVYRAALNADEVAHLHDGKLFAASLEVYAPLVKAKLKPNRILENRAWSTSVVLATPADVTADLAALEQKILAARIARDNEFVPEEKEVVAVDPEVLALYAGSYEVAPGDVVTIVSEDKCLYLVDRGEKVELFAESEQTFFIRTVGDITLTFVRDDAGAVIKMVLSANGREIPAKRVN